MEEILSDMLSVSKEVETNEIAKIIKNDKISKLKRIRRDKISYMTSIVYNLDVPQNKISDTEILYENKIMNIVKNGGEDLGYLLLTLLAGQQSNKDLVEVLNKEKYNTTPVTINPDFNWDK